MMNFKTWLGEIALPRQVVQQRARLFLISRDGRVLTPDWTLSKNRADAAFFTPSEYGPAKDRGEEATGQQLYVNYVPGQP